jgi:hypothetical protein
MELSSPVPPSYIIGAIIFIFILIAIGLLIVRYYKQKEV